MIADHGWWAQRLPAWFGTWFSCRYPKGNVDRMQFYNAFFKSCWQCDRPHTTVISKKACFQSEWFTVLIYLSYQDNFTQHTNCGVVLRCQFQSPSLDRCANNNQRSLELIGPRCPIFKHRDIFFFGCSTVKGLAPLKQVWRVQRSLRYLALQDREARCEC